MFLTDKEVEQMTGCRQSEHKPVRLKNWLDAYGYVLGVTYFKRIDGWYSVMAPQSRAVDVGRPRVRQRA